MSKIGYIKTTKLKEYREENTPDTCPILGVDTFDPVLDHDHKSGRIRGVISNEANVLIGKIENNFRSRCAFSELDLPEVLRNIAEYLEKEQNEYHPVGIRQLTNRFKAKSKDVQVQILLEKGIPRDDIDNCKNRSERSKIYRDLLIND